MKGLRVLACGRALQGVLIPGELLDRCLGLRWHHDSQQSIRLKPDFFTGCTCMDLSKASVECVGHGT